MCVIGVQGKSYKQNIDGKIFRGEKLRDFLITIKP